LSLRLISRLHLVLLFAGALLFSARAWFAQFETPPPPGQPIPGTQGVSPFAGSVPAKSVPGVTDTVEVVQSQEAVASAHEQYISSLYHYNFARISLVRAMGIAEAGVKEYFKGK
jgi:hypothetical protein